MIKPEKGEKIYVPSVVHTYEPNNDFNGGIATIENVKINTDLIEEHANYLTVTVKERPNHPYGWGFIRSNQERWKLLYGKKLAGSPEKAKS